VSTKPIAPEIKQVSGFANRDELKAALPRNLDPSPEPASQPENKKPRAKRKPTAAPQGAPDPFLNDKRYQDACAEMAAFGGKGVIERGFEAGAVVLDDPKFKLSASENRTWDNFFYVLSKKPIFDVGTPWFLAAFFVITLAAQLGWRVLERTESEFIKDLFRKRFGEDEREISDEAKTIDDENPAGFGKL
jgi:hypothetical protein